MYKYGAFQVGQKIKAFNFEPIPGREEDYIVGTILAVNGQGTEYHPYAHYTVNIEQESDPTGAITAFVPMETSMDYDGRITLLPQ